MIRGKEEQTAREYLTLLLLETEGYDGVDRAKLKKDLKHLNEKYA